MELNNKYYILRHGQAVSNIKNLNSSWPEKFENPLTEKGVGQVKEAAKILSKKNIDLIFASPILRAKQTAEIVGKEIGVNPEFDKRLREIDFANFNGEPRIDLEDFFNDKESAESKFKDVENYYKISDRMCNFLREVDEKYKDKNILVVSHEAPLSALIWKVKNLSVKDGINKDPEKTKNGEVRELN